MERLVGKHLSQALLGNVCVTLGDLLGCSEPVSTSVKLHLTLSEVMTVFHMMVRTIKQQLPTIWSGPWLIKTRVQGKDLPYTIKQLRVDIDQVSPAVLKFPFTIHYVSDRHLLSLDSSSSLLVFLFWLFTYCWGQLFP